MDDLLAVDVVHSTDNLLEERAGLFLLQKFAALYIATQLPACSNSMMKQIDSGWSATSKTRMI